MPAMLEPFLCDIANQPREWGGNVVTGWKQAETGASGAGRQAETCQGRGRNRGVGIASVPVVGIASVRAHGPFGAG